MEWLILVGVTAVIVLVKYLASRKSAEPGEKHKSIYHYERKVYLMSHSESDFLKTLLNVIGNSYHVFPQVHLSAILEHKIKGQSWKGAFSHINSKSVDFVICDKSSFRPLLAVELDDWSHEAENRKERDTEVERMLEEVSLPLIRFNNWRQMSNEEIHQRLSYALPIQ